LDMAILQTKQKYMATIGDMKTHYLQMHTSMLLSVQDLSA